MTEAAGDFLLHFDHADITFGEVIVKGHREIFEEAQDLLLPLGQSIQQSAGEALTRAPSAGHQWGSHCGIGSVACAQQLLTALAQLQPRQGIQGALTAGSCVLNGLFHLQQ